MMSGSPLPDQNMRGSWKPGMLGKAVQAPVQASAGVGGILIITGGVTQRSPPEDPRTRWSEGVHSVLAGLEDVALEVLQIFASQSRDS